jgi:hypothetical protein
LSSKRARSPVRIKAPNPLGRVRRPPDASAEESRRTGVQIPSGPPVILSKSFLSSEANCIATWPQLVQTCIEMDNHSTDCIASAREMRITDQSTSKLLGFCSANGWDRTYSQTGTSPHGSLELLAFSFARVKPIVLIYRS